MCNLYSITRGQDAIRQAFKVTRDLAGNLPAMPGVFPDYPAPIVRNAARGLELALARWGMPTSSKGADGCHREREACGKRLSTPYFSG